MKKCPKCNVELPDEAMFCNNCGANLSEVVAEQPVTPVEAPIVEPSNNETLETAKAQSKNAKIGLIAVVAAGVVVAIIMICALVSLLGGGYKTPVNTLIKNVNKRSTNVESYIGAFAPKFVTNTYKEVTGIIKSTSKEAYEDMNEAINEGIEDLFDDLEDEYGDDFKVSIEYTKTEKLDKDELDDFEDSWEDVADLLSKADIDDDDIYEDLSDEFDDEYDVEISGKNQKKLVKLAEDLIDDCENVKITEGYHIKAKITIKGDEDKDTEKVEFYILKVNGQWIIDVTSYASSYRYLLNSFF